MDLDTLPSRRLDDFDYAITTTAAYQSSPPSNFREVARTDSYILWARDGRTPRLQVLPNEDGAPGEELECPAGVPQADAPAAAILPQPVVLSAKDWSRRSPFEAPGSARQSLRLRPGTWQLSIQYHSQVDLTVEALGLRAELPASLVGMYLTHQGQGSFWPVGEVEVPANGSAAASGEPVRVDVAAAEPSALERALGAPRRVWLGELAATRLDPTAGSTPRAVALADACGDYVDHMGAGGALANLRP
jgi:hypothetical protein